MAAEVDDDEKYLYGGENGAIASKGGITEISEKRLDTDVAAFISSAGPISSIKQEEDSTENNIADNDEEDSYEEDDDDDDDDDVQVTIDENNTAGAYGASFGTAVNWAPKGAAASAKPAAGTTGDAKRLDLEAVGQVNNVSIFEYDIDLGTDEKPWRKPGADITDYFNYGFTEDTWKQYCERQRRLRMEVSGQKKVFPPSSGPVISSIVPGIPSLPDGLKAGPPPDRRHEGTIDVIGGSNSHIESRRRHGIDDPMMAFPPPDMNFARSGFPRPFPKTFPGPMQVPPPGMFPRHPNLPPGMRPPFMAPGMPPPMSTGFQMPVAPPNEPSVSMSNPPSSGAPISSVAGQIPGSGPDQVGSVMAPPHGMMPPLGGGQGPTHIFGPDGTPLEGLPPGMHMATMPGSADMFGRGPMDQFLPGAQVNSVFPQWDMNAFHENFSRSPDRVERPDRGSDVESDSENKRHRRRDKDRHREHRDRDRESTRDKDRDRDKDRERRHRDRDRRDRDRDKDKDKDRSRTRDKDRSSRRSERSKESKSDRKKIRSGSRQQEDSEDADTPRKKPRRSRAAAEESYQEETKEEGEASD